MANELPEKPITIDERLVAAKIAAYDKIDSLVGGLVTIPSAEQVAKEVTDPLVMQSHKGMNISPSTIVLTSKDPKDLGYAHLILSDRGVESHIFTGTNGEAERVTIEMNATNMEALEKATAIHIVESRPAAPVSKMEMTSIR